MNIIQETVNWLETKIDKSIKNEEIVQFTGYSFYHFHRLFQEHVGMSLHEYVRQRRITSAATKLIYSDTRILDIAFSYQFESQESFTRAFRKVYGLPPGKYRRLMRTLLEEENQQEVEKMEGWFLSGTNSERYEISRDFENVLKGNASGQLRSKGQISKEDFGTVMQQFNAKEWLGKRVKLSCFIQTKDVENSAGLWMRVDGKDGDTLQFDNMQDRPIIGTTGWNHYWVVLDVPVNAGAIYFGVMLQGAGKVWMDEFTFFEVDEKTPSTNMMMPENMPNKPVNLNFELEFEM
ncbi:helix-turn-helix transcriptional regulator [Psychrobacillus lasiicapitis]|uniref:helix-turn-helix transcriptional regulator n=1 Tax=Psychrobacillus lasiicapitis TaxID=1636719 RepID=UPI00198ACDA2|nr:AraC family transcriptional regulator [Psychrobacillus lasiicapitis]GGA41949.1 putative HTH-type transcriptional regulator YbfP [Psychrobacillus lasiicapitis]